MEKQNEQRHSLQYVAGTVLPMGLRFNEDIEADVDAGQNGDVNNTGKEHEARMAALERNQAIQNLLADPDIQAVIKAKREGKQLSITEAQAKEEELPDEPALEIPDDDPLKATLTRLDDVMSKRLDFFNKKLDARFQELETKSGQLEAVAASVQKKEVNEQVEGAKKKYQDFDKVKGEILELSKAHPGLSVDQLALLALDKKGLLKLQKTSTASERPTSQPPRPFGGTKKPGQEPKTGQRAWRSLLQEALGEIDLNQRDE